MIFCCNLNILINWATQEHQYEVILYKPIGFIGYYKNTSLSYSANRANHPPCKPLVYK